MTCKLTFPRVPLVLALLVALATSPALAQKGNKPIKEEPIVEEPITTPTGYTVETIPVAGLVRSVGFNNVECLCYVKSTIVTGPEYTALIVNIETGQATAIDEMLTEPTSWSSFMPTDINRWGDVLGQATILDETSNTNSSEVFLLRRVVSEGSPSYSYKPISLGDGGASFLNDLGDVAMARFDANGVVEHVVRFADGTDAKIDNDVTDPISQINGLNNAGQVLGNLSIPGWNSFVWTPKWTTVETGVIIEPHVDYPQFFDAHDINDASILSGITYATYEVTLRGKTTTSTYYPPAVHDPVTGLRTLDFPEKASAAIPVRINNQSTVVAPRTTNDMKLNLWVILPERPGFYVYDSMDASNKEKWLGISFRQYEENTYVSNPEPEDGAIEAPIVIGTNVVYANNDSTPIGLWVLRPTGPLQP